MNNRFFLIFSLMFMQAIFCADDDQRNKRSLETSTSSALVPYEVKDTRSLAQPLQLCLALVEIKKLENEISQLQAQMTSLEQERQKDIKLVKESNTLNVKRAAQSADQTTQKIKSDLVESKNIFLSSEQLDTKIKEVAKKRKALITTQKLLNAKLKQKQMISTQLRLYNRLPVQPDTVEDRVYVNFTVHTAIQALSRFKPDEVQYFKAAFESLLKLVTEANAAKIAHQNKRFLSIDSAINAQAPHMHGKRPLHMTIQVDVERIALWIAKKLLENGANVNGTDNSGDTPLGHAAQAGRRNLASLFLEYKALLNTNSVNGSPLTQASEAGHIKLMKLLLSAAGIVRDPEALAAVERKITYYTKRLAALHPDDETVPLVKQKLVHYAACKDLLEKGSNPS